MKKTIDLPAMRRTADVVPSTINEEDRSIEVVWSTGARVRRHDWWSGTSYDEELDLDPSSVRLDRLNNRAPVLKVHNMYDLDSVIGSVVPNTARIENGQGIARVQFSDREDVVPIWDDVRAGHIRAVSIGYQVHLYEITRTPDNGPDLWRAMDWTPFEISAVPIGADPAAGFRSVDRLNPCVLDRADAPERKTTMSNAETIVAPAAVAPSADPPAVEPVTQTRAAPTAPGTSTEPVDAIVARAQQVEQERCATIYDLTARLGLERSFGDGLIRNGTTIDDARRIILDKVAEQSERSRTSSHVQIPIGGLDATVTRREAVANALLHRYDPGRHKLTDAAREYRGLTLIEMAREALTAAGVNVRGLSRDEIATRALHSTSDFPNILSAVTNKTLRNAYEAAPRTFLPFCRQTTVSDFKDKHSIQLGEAPQLLEVNEGGEFKRGTIGESKESYRIKTFGRVVGITRQVIINDDLDAFTRIPALYGRAIATLESDVVWGIITANAAMADGVALFHATHKNLAGTAAAIDVASLGLARADMAKQTGIDKKTLLNIRPAFLIVPSALELKAEQIVAQNLLPAKSTDVVPQSLRSLQPISEPRLDAASATAWYLAANPSDIDTIEYAYLEGQEGAYIETRNGFDVDGVEIKCRLDFGAKAIDWRGLYKNAGT